MPPFGHVMPMTFGQILDRIFRLTRANIWPFLAIGVLPIAVVIVFEAVLFGGLFLAGGIPIPPAHPDPNPAAFLWIAPALLIFYPVMFMVYGIYYGASSYAAVQADHGVKVSAGEAIRHAWSKLGRYVWLYFLRILIIALPILAAVLIIGIGGLLLVYLTPNQDLTNTNPAALFFLVPLGILFYLGAFAYAIYMSLRYALAFPACVHENITASQALERSGKLTHGAKGRIFLMALVIYAIASAAFLIVYALGLFLFAIGAFATGGHIDGHLPLIIALAVIGGLIVLVVILVWSALFMAAYSITFAVFYRDQCLRKDGLLPAPAQ